MSHPALIQLHSVGECDGVGVRVGVRVRVGVGSQCEAQGGKEAVPLKPWDLVMN